MDHGPDLSGLVDRASGGDAGAARELVAALHPVVRARVARVLWHRRAGAARDLRQELLDLSQEAFAFLFGDGAKALRSWKSDGGMSFLNYVGLISERRIISVLRHDQGPVEHESLGEDSLDPQDPAPGPEPAALSRERLAILLDRVRLAVSPLGLHMFELIYVQELAPEDVASQCQLSIDAVYAWRSRLRKLVGRLAEEMAAADDTPGPRSVAGGGRSGE
jgi:RNA polymerase sigma-70 factor (ECF subfamily)